MGVSTQVHGQKMGFKEGQGLGKNDDGITDCIQIKRRDEGQALGADKEGPAGTFKWNDMFWTDVYNKAAANLKSHNSGKLVESDSDSSSEDSDSDDSGSSFDGALVIKKKTEPILIKSKAIKKEKKEIKEKKEKKDKKDKKKKDKKSK